MIQWKKSRHIGYLLVIALVALSSTGESGKRTNIIESRRANRAQRSLQNAYAQLPLSFEANLGQVDEEVKFLSRGDGYSLFLTGNEAVLALRAPAAKAASQLSPTPTGDAVLRMQL